MAEDDTRRARRYAQIRRRERAIEQAAAAALAQLAERMREQLRSAGYDTSVFSKADPEWQASIDNDVLPEVDQTFIDGLRDLVDSGSTDAQAYASMYLETVRNRLVNVADGVFDQMRTELRDGILKGETIPELSARVDALLADQENWTGRARTIARTEAIGANNAGAFAGARIISAKLGVETAQVAKRWLATFDARTRETHADASGQVVVGLDTPFHVGSTTLMRPGDANGPGREVINCRCTVLYLMPGDPGYPETLAASGGHDMTTTAIDPADVARLRQLAADSPWTVAEFVERLTSALAAGSEDDPDVTDTADANTSTVIVALPSSDDDVQNIGPAPDKHATILWFAEVPAETSDAIQAAVRDYLAGDGSSRTVFDQDTTGEVALLGDDDPQAVVLMLSAAGELGGIRDELLALDAIKTPHDATKQWPTFTPHVTLGYGDEVTQEDKDAAAALTTVTFDRLAVWVGEDQTEYPLGEADAAAPAAPADPNAQTAAADPVVAPADVAATDETWEGVLGVEGVETGDHRLFREGAIGWLKDPGILHAMFNGGSGWGGHEDAVPVGLITSIERKGSQLVAKGTWGSEEEAVKARRMNVEGTLRGVSLDLDDVEISFQDADGNPIEGDDLWEIDIDEPEPTLVIEVGRVRGATLWTIPAFVEAYVLDSTVASEVPDTSWASEPQNSPASLAAAGAMLDHSTRSAAPLAAFANPGLTVPTPLTITDDGRVFGHLATWGTCHIGIDGACVTPPTSESDYAYFLIGSYVTSDGADVPVGKLTMDTGHADLSLSASKTLAHYDNTGMAAAYVNVGEDDVGIWYAGALSEGLDVAKAQQLARAGALSGDWRKLAGHLELVAALAVNTPGFPIPTVRARVASAQQTALVASGILTQPEHKQEQSESFRLAVAQEVRAFQRREVRRELVSSRLRQQRRERSLARINGR